MAIDDYSQWITLDVRDSLRQAAFQSIDAFPSMRVAEIPGPENRTVGITWRFINEQDFQDFIDDFYLVGYHAAFPFTVPGDSSASKFRFSVLSQTAVANNLWTVAATLEKFNGV
jgi:hypothetical protein